MNVYPGQMRQILAYIDALDAADAALIAQSDRSYTLDIDLRIEVVDEDGTVLGHIKDEIGGAWSFEAVA